MKEAVLLLVLACAQSLFADGSQPCIGSNDRYGLEQSLLKWPQNVQGLRRAFFATNRQASIAVQVHYCFNNSDLCLQYRWVDSSINMLIRPDLLKFFSLFMYNVEILHANITLNLFCDFKESEIKVDFQRYCYPSGRNTAHMLLNEFTANVSCIRGTIIILTIMYNSEVIHAFVVCCTSINSPPLFVAKVRGKG